jgi:hypothetical protein
MTGVMSLSEPEVGRASLMSFCAARTLKKINTPHGATVIVNEAMNVVEQPVPPSVQMLRPGKYSRAGNQKLASMLL